MELALLKMGNSTCVIIPKAVLREVGLARGSKVDLEVADGKMVLRPITEHPRAGWAEAAALIGAEPLTDDEKDWLAFGNEWDAEWTW